MGDEKPKLGEMCWLEIPVHDASRARELYGDIFGWDCKPDGVPHGRDGVKSMHFFNKGAIHGAFLVAMDGYQATKYGRLDKEMLPPLPTFCVDDCTVTLNKVEVHGGKVQCPKTEIGGNMGYYARFTDTEGNIIGIWSQT